MNPLSQKTCTPCVEQTVALRELDYREFQRALHEDWRVIDEHHLTRTFRFPDFKSALAFTNRVGELAEKDDHHPSLLLSFGEVIVTLFTHRANGLTENDFFLASKIDLQFS